MKFSFSAEQLQLRDSVSRFFSDVSTSSNIRTQMETQEGFDRAYWKRLHSELGVGGVHISSEYGGADLTFVELSIVLEEMGKALFCSPYLSSCVFAATVIEKLGNQEQKAKYLPPLISGDRIGTLAIYEEGSAFEPQQISAIVNKGTLTTVKTLASDGLTADIALVLAKSGVESPTAFYIADLHDSGISRRTLQTMDATRKLAKISFNDVPVELLGGVVPSPEQLQYIYSTLFAALASEMIGGAAHLLESAVEYSKNRVQFGRTISSFQTIKHRCAELLLEVEFAKSAVYRAVQAISEDDPELNQYCSLAKAVANDAYLRAAVDCIQIHGGIGFTWENDTHLWFKRAKSSEVFLGNSSFHRERFLAEMGL